MKKSFFFKNNVLTQLSIKNVYLQDLKKSKTNVETKIIDKGIPKLWASFKVKFWECSAWIILWEEKKVELFSICIVENVEVPNPQKAFSWIFINDGCHIPIIGMKL